jgi:hypothetical protein
MIVFSQFWSAKWVKPNIWPFCFPGLGPFIAFPFYFHPIYSNAGPTCHLGPTCQIGPICQMVPLVSWVPLVSYSHELVPHVSKVQNTNYSSELGHTFTQFQSTHMICISNITEDTEFIK